jgi:hypothetical protein
MAVILSKGGQTKLFDDVQIVLLQVRSNGGKCIAALRPTHSKFHNFAIIFWAF